MIMHLITAYLKSPLGILKLTCLFVIVLLVALSTYTHFNSHWVYHSRMADREEVSIFNLSGRDKLTEFRNEYEECRYNSRLYTGIALIDSPEKVNGFGARQYESTPENACPHPVMELFLVVTSVSILIVSLLSLMAIAIWLPVMVYESRSIKFYRILDIVLFSLAALFLFISLVMFWYSTDNIWEWCSLKTSMVAFTFKASGSGRSGGGSGRSGVVGVGANGKRNLRLQHDDTVDIITGSDDNYARSVETYQVPIENYQAPVQNNQVPFKQYSGAPSRNTIIVPTAGPPAVLYLTRVKRETPNIELRVVEASAPYPRARTEFEMELQKIRQDQYMDLCNVRQMTYEKYFTVAAAFIALILHLVVVVLIFLKCGKGEVHDSHAHDEEIRRELIIEDDISNSNKRPKSGSESRPKSGSESRPKSGSESRPKSGSESRPKSGQEGQQNKRNSHNDKNVPTDNYKSDGNHANNHSPNGRRTSPAQPHRNDEVARQNENGQANFSTQPNHKHHEGDHKHKPQGIHEASGPS